MTDWDLMIECIRNAMQAMDEAGHTAESLGDQHTREEINRTRQQMLKLVERLSNLKIVLNNQAAFATDELADMLNQAFTGKHTEYRRTPRMNPR